MASVSERSADISWQKKLLSCIFPKQRQFYNTAERRERNLKVVLVSAIIVAFSQHFFLFLFRSRHISLIFDC